MSIDVWEHCGSTSVSVCVKVDFSNLDTKSEISILRLLILTALYTGSMCGTFHLGDTYSTIVDLRALWGRTIKKGAGIRLYKFS